MYVKYKSHEKTERVMPDIILRATTTVENPPSFLPPPGGDDLSRDRIKRPTTADYYIIILLQDTPCYDNARHDVKI